MTDPLFELCETVAAEVLMHERYSPALEPRVHGLAVAIQRAVTEWLICHPAEPIRGLREGDRVHWHSQAQPALRVLRGGEPLEAMTVLHVADDGMVEVSGFSGLFAPHLFELVEESPAL